MQTAESQQGTQTAGYRVMATGVVILFALFCGAVGFWTAVSLVSALPSITPIARLFIAILIVSGFFLLSVVAGRRFFKFGKGNYKKIGSRVAFLAVIFSVVLSVVGISIPSRYVSFGIEFEGLGKRFYGRGFPGLVWFSGTETRGPFGSGTVRTQFEEECMRRRGAIEEFDIPGLYSNTCVYSNIFDRKAFITNIVYWSVISLFIAVVVVTLPRKKKNTLSSLLAH